MAFLEKLSAKHTSKFGHTPVNLVKTCPKGVIWGIRRAREALLFSKIPNVGVLIVNRTNTVQRPTFHISTNESFIALR